MDEAQLARRLACPLPEEADATGPGLAAAVLVPIVTGAAPGVVLTRRNAALAHHPDQVCFPGGRIKPTDASPEAAALREAKEEIGLDPSLVRLIGRLPRHVTGTGFAVIPVLGLIPSGLAFAPRSSEVSAILILPLAVLLDPRAPERQKRVLAGGEEREFWVWPHPEHDIWGATAAILVGLARHLRRSGD